MIGDAMKRSRPNQVAIALLLVVCAPVAGQAGPPGVDLPYIISPACPGEGCTFGEWLACEATPLHQTMDDASPVLTTIPADQSFVVTTGAVAVTRPGIVELTKALTIEADDGSTHPAAVGDTLFVFDYIGEGFYRARLGGAFHIVYGFWPLPGFFSAEPQEYAGRVRQEPATTFWVRTTHDGAEGWVAVDETALAMPNLFERGVPLQCPGKAGT